MYFVKTPKIAHTLFKKAVWNIPNDKNGVYLTFDDGPTPSITDQTLDILAKHQIKATFFCLGKQVEKHPELFQRVIDEGHSIGNHSFSHLNGWVTENEKYMDDVQKGHTHVQSNLFRPPYGKIRRSQIKQLSKSFKIIMWDVLPGDFSPKNSVETIVSNTISAVEPGSIIVLHDNDKCGDKMLKALPVIIKKMIENKYNFLPITKNELP